MHLCKFGNPLHIDTNYFDLKPEFKKKQPTVKFKHGDLRLDSKSLGPKLRDEVDSLLSRAMMGRFGLKPWVDDKNKLRCPEGTPAANQFTDTMMSNCFILSPATAAGTANRAVRRAGGAIANASEVGGRTQGGFTRARNLANLTQQDFIDMGYDEVSRLMATGGRIVGAMTGPPGQRYDPKLRTGATEPYLLGAKEAVARGQRATMLAKVNHKRIIDGMLRMPNGELIGDITQRHRFIEVMHELFPNIDINELAYYFDNAIPAGIQSGLLNFGEKRKAKLAVRTFWEGIIAEAIENPTHAKWVTRLQTDYNMPNVMEVTVDPFAPTIDDKGRIVSAAGQKLVNQRNAAQGGIHMVMKINPFQMYRYPVVHKSQGGKGNASGFADSIEGTMHYLATHEFGHLAHFSSAMQALGFDVNTLNRYQPQRAFATAQQTGAGATWRPTKESGGWIIDFTQMQNPLNSQSIELVRQAAWNLQNRQYTGGRGNFNSQDLKQDLAEFYDALGEAFHNNITDTADDRNLMRMFAGGEYAASNEIEVRAEYYAARRLFGETNDQNRILRQTSQRGGIPLGYGPTRASTASRNYVDDFVNAVTSTGRGNQNQTVGYFGANPADVVFQMDRIGAITFGVRSGTWNITGAMSTGDLPPRASIHAEQVRRAVRNNENKTRRKRPKKQEWQPLTTSRIGSNITGRMSTKPIYYPREPSYGAFIGDAQQIFDGATTWEEFKKLYNDKEIIFFDYETTGIELDKDGRTIAKGSPVQIGAVKMKGGKVIDRFNVFMRPDRPLGEWSAKNLKDKDGNRLTDEWLSKQMSIADAHKLLSEFAGENAIFGVQYAPFDKDVLDDTLKSIGMRWKPAGYLDTKDIAEHTLPRWSPESQEGPSKIVKEKILDDGTVVPEHRAPSNGLADITTYLGVKLGEKHHTADADSEAAGLVMSGIIDKAIEKQLPTTVLDMKSQNERIAKAKADYETAVAEFEQTVAQRNSQITGSMSTSSKIASTRKSNRKTKQIVDDINKEGGNFGGDTSLRYIEKFKPGQGLLGPTSIRQTQPERLAARTEHIASIRNIAATMSQPNAAEPGTQAGRNAQDALNGLDPAFHRYLSETSAEELAKDLNAAIADFHEGLDIQPRTHVHGRHLRDVVENGFQNTHQQNAIKGVDTVFGKYEADIGIHPNTPAELRPAMGFVLHRDELEREQKDIMKLLENSGKEDADRYFPNLVDFPHSKRTRGNDWNFGNAEIILNPGVANRTAYGNGDLFNNHIEPAGMLTDDNEVVMRAHVDSAFKNDNRVENIVEHLYNHFKDDHNAYRREKYRTSPGRNWEPRGASIAGGFNADDIDEVRIPFDSMPLTFIDGHPQIPQSQKGPMNANLRNEIKTFLENKKHQILNDDRLAKLGFSEEERKTVRDILSSGRNEYVIPDSLQKHMPRYGVMERDIKDDVDKLLKVESARAMKKSFDDKGINTSITNKFGLDIFNPKSFDKDASKKLTPEEVLRNRIEKQMIDIINDMRIAEWMSQNDPDADKPIMLKPFKQTPPGTRSGPEMDIEGYDDTRRDGPEWDLGRNNDDAVEYAANGKKNKGDK